MGEFGEFNGNLYDSADVEAYIEQARGATEVERIKAAVLLQNQALKGLVLMIMALKDHIDEHHDVLNGQARALETLEQLVLGGEPDETPTP